MTGYQKRLEAIREIIEAGGLPSDAEGAKRFLLANAGVDGNARRLLEQIELTELKLKKGATLPQSE